MQLSNYELPKDIWLKIFEELNFSSLVAVAGTNRQLRQLVREEYASLISQIDALYTLAAEDVVNDHAISMQLRQLECLFSAKPYAITQFNQYQSHFLSKVEKAGIPPTSIRAQFRFLFFYNYFGSFEPFMVMSLVKYRTLYLLKFQHNLQFNHQLILPEQHSIWFHFFNTLSEHSTGIFMLLVSVALLWLLKFLNTPFEDNSLPHSIQSVVPTFNFMIGFSYLINANSHFVTRASVVALFALTNLAMGEMLNMLEFKDSFTTKLALTLTLLQTSFMDSNGSYFLTDSLMPLAYIGFTAFLTISFMTRKYGQLKDMNDGFSELLMHAAAQTLRDTTTEQADRRVNREFTGRIDAAIDILEQSDCSKEALIHALRALPFPRQPSPDNAHRLFQAYQETRRDTEEWANLLQFQPRNSL